MRDVSRDEAVAVLARKIYLHYCTEKGFDPFPYPWVPRWAIDYAGIAVSAYGFEDDDVAVLKAEVTGTTVGGGE